MKKFEEVGNIGDKLNPMHHRDPRAAKNIAAVSKRVAEYLVMSIRRRSQHLQISYVSLWRILHLNLHLHPYKIQLTQELAVHGISSLHYFTFW